MRYFVPGLLMTLLLTACSCEKRVAPPAAAVPRTTTTRSTLPPNDDSPMGLLIEYLQSQGFSGEYVALPTTSVAGAGQSGSFKGKGFAVTFYHFADPNLASSVASEGMNGRMCYANGTLLMAVAMADESFVQAFLAYQ